MVFVPRRLWLAAPLLLLPFSTPRVRAQARFDLTGPKIDVRVTRQGESLPIATVPNLLAGDRMWLHPDLPPTQSVHYLLIAVFLRGNTNPPPDDWFTRIETWNKKVREEGVTIVVPEEAQQAILFLAPETGGDFSTLRSAVKGRPGVFVRASQDLTEAGFEQARTDAYVAAMKQLATSDPADLQKHSDLLARTLSLRPNPDCFKRPVEQQYNCLTQTGAQMLLDDGHGETIVAALSTGPGSDFINTASTTRLAGGGTYSAYVGTLVDFVHIMSGLHTAQYQYIPALASPRGESLNLRLNTPPSFHNPKSVIVISLPGVQASVPPPLRAAEPNRISCLLEPKMVLPIEGAPLVFSTGFAHDLVLHLDTPTGNDIPLAPDAFQGGLALMPTEEPERRELPTVPIPGLNFPGAPEYKEPPSSADKRKPPDDPGPIVTGTVKGVWGFDPFTGPTLPLQRTPGSGWRIVAAAPGTPGLIAGQPNRLQLASNGTACIRSIEIEPGGQRVDWKLASSKPATADSKPGSPAPTRPGATPQPAPVDLTLNLQHTAAPGALELAIAQYGESKPAELALKTFSEPAKIDTATFHQGDTSIELTGSSLDQVRELTLRQATFTPVHDAVHDAVHEDGVDSPSAAEKTPARLSVSLPFGDKPPDLKPGERTAASVALRDGRTLEVPLTVAGPRPAVEILSRRVTATQPSPILLSGADEVPLGAQIVFFLKAQGKFPRTEEIEVANADESLHTRLNLGNGSLVLQDAHTAFATLDPLKTFGPSVFGPLQLRAVAADGTPGNWLPLATIVRLPTLTALQCGGDPAQPCVLTGSALYLLDGVAADAAFTHPSAVPEGYIDSTLPVPHPDATGRLYLKLRDDPASVQQAALPIQLPPDATPKHALNNRLAKPTAKPAPALEGAAPASTSAASRPPAAPVPTTQPAPPAAAAPSASPSGK